MCNHISNKPKNKVWTDKQRAEWARAYYKQHFEKPSVKKAREKAEAVRRARKLARKKMIREGLL